MRLYLGGKMIGLPNFGFELFDQAEMELLAMGHTVFNPANHDRNMGFKAEGLDGTWNEENSQGLNRHELLLDDFTWIIRRSEGMVALSNWEDSPGARAEVAVHQSIYLPVWRLDDFLRYGENAIKFKPLKFGGWDRVER
jgi:hypothetical protein